MSLQTSAGPTGSIDGVATLVAAARADGPTLWLDAGDLTGGPLWSLTGRRSWKMFTDLDIDAMAVGNHELDEGVRALGAGRTALPFPLLCADVVELGLPDATLLETSGGTIGVIGLTNPHLDRLAPAPRPADPGDPVRHAARRLRNAGAQWVISLQHDGVDWWPVRGGIGVSAERWVRSTASWRSSVDAVLGGHTLGAWYDDRGDTVFGHAHPFATSALVVDFLDGAVLIRGLVKIPHDVAPSSLRYQAAEVLRSSRTQLVGENPHLLTTSPRGPRDRYLPRVVAEAIRSDAGAEAAFLLSSSFFTQAPLDGASASLAAGPVSRLDLHRLFPFPGDDIVVIELEAGEAESLVATHDYLAAPAERAGDAEWWNWNRVPAGLSTTKEHPRTVAVTQYSLPLVERWLQRRPAAHRVGGARAALERWFAR